MVTAAIIAPKSSGKAKFLNLRNLKHLDIYQLIITYLQNEYPDLRIVDDMTAEPGTNILFAARSMRVLPFIIKDGIRFGSATTTRTDADQFAGIRVENAHVVPCKMLYHFQVLLPQSQDRVIYVSAVQKCVVDLAIPIMPWDLLWVFPVVYRHSVSHNKHAVRLNLVRRQCKQTHLSQFRLFHLRISLVR